MLKDFPNLKCLADHEQSIFDRSKFKPLTQNKTNIEDSDDKDLDKMDGSINFPLTLRTVLAIRLSIFEDFE